MKSKLSKSMLKNHKNTISQGFPDRLLSACLGVSVRSVRRWKSIGKRVFGTKKSELSAHERLCVRFYELRAAGHARLICKLWDCLVKRAETDWKAARYLLSVLSPEDFSNRGIAVRAVQRDVNAEIADLSPGELQQAIERESLEIVLSALRAGDLQTASLISKSTDLGAGGFSADEFLQGLRELKNSILNGDGGDGDGDDAIERQLMSLERERA